MTAYRPEVSTDQYTQMQIRDDIIEANVNKLSNSITDYAAVRSHCVCRAFVCARPLCSLQYRLHPQEGVDASHDEKMEVLRKMDPYYASMHRFPQYKHTGVRMPLHLLDGARSLSILRVISWCR